MLVEVTLVEEVRLSGTELPYFAGGYSLPYKLHFSNISQVNVVLSGLCEAKKRLSYNDEDAKLDVVSCRIFRLFDFPCY